MYEVAYVDVLGKARLVPGEDRLDRVSQRLLDVSRLMPFQLPEAEVPPANEPDLTLEFPVEESVPDAQNAAGVAGGVAVAGLAVPMAPDLREVEVENANGSVIVKIQGLSAKEQERADADEILFTLEERSGEKYAAYIADVSLTLLSDVVHLSVAEKAAVIYTTVNCRESLWVPGSAYSRVKGAHHELDTGEAPAVTQHPFRRSPEQTSDVEWHIKQSVALGVLAPGVGAWATPAFVVKQKGKPHGRLVCDYRKVNMVTKRMYHPMPAVMEVIRRVTGATVFSGLDAVSGFNQLRLSKKAQEKLAITVPSGLYFWLVLPFGPVDGPQAFTAVMRWIFGNKVSRNLR